MTITQRPGGDAASTIIKNYDPIQKINRNDIHMIKYAVSARSAYIALGLHLLDELLSISPDKK